MSSGRPGDQETGVMNKSIVSKDKHMINYSTAQRIQDKKKNPNTECCKSVHGKSKCLH